MFNLRKHIESQLKSYLGSPIIPSLSQDDEAVKTAFTLGLAEYWTICPIERPHSMNVSAGLVTISLDNLLENDIPIQYRNYAYFVGLPFIQFNPVSSVLQTPYASATGASTLDYMVLGTNARNLSVTGGSNIMRGYSNQSQKNPFANVARGSVVNNIQRTMAYQKLASWSGVSGSVEYNFNSLENKLEFNVPATTSGILKYVVGYGFTVQDAFDNETSIQTEQIFDDILAIVPMDSVQLITKLVARKFFELIIAARGQCNFSGADYSLDVSKLESTKSKFDTEIEKMSVEFGRRLMSWQ